MSAHSNMHMFMHMLHIYTRTLRAPCLPLRLGAGRWEENKRSALASLCRAVAVHFHGSVPTQSDIGCVQPPGCYFPVVQLDVFKINQVRTAGAAGQAKARSAWPGHVAGSLGIMLSTRILAGSSPTLPSLQTRPLWLVALLSPRCLGKRRVTKAEECTCARGAVLLFGVLPRFFHPGENLLGETGVCTEVGFAGGSFTAPRLVIAVATGAVGGRVWGR